MTIEYEINKDYRICEMCHSMFCEDNFKSSCQPNTIHITDCPYCGDKKHFVKIAVKIKEK